MGFFILLFLFIGILEFFLVTRAGKWRFSAVVLPASAFFFWMDRQSYWMNAGPDCGMSYTLELMLVGVWAAAAILGAVAGLVWDRRRKRSCST